MRIIEFSGLPASGKSTLLKAMQEHAQEELRGYPFISALPRRSFIPGRLAVPAGCELLLSSAVSPALHERLFRHGRLGSGLNREMLVHLSRASRLFRIISHLRQAQRGTFVLDQGLVQSLGSLIVPGSGRAIPPADLALFRTIKSHVDGLVHLDCDPLIAVERLNNRRGRSRFDSEFGGLGREELVRLYRFLDQTATYLASIGLPVLRLPAAGDSTDNASRTLQWMKSLATEHPVLTSIPAQVTTA
jgi:thymidylate kinase